MVELDTKIITYYQVWSRHKGAEYCSPNHVVGIKTAMTDDYELTWDVDISYFNEEALSFTDSEFVTKVLKKCGIENYQRIKKVYKIITQEDNITTFYIVRNDYREECVADLNVTIDTNGNLDYKPVVIHEYETTIPLAFENEFFAKDIQLKLGDSFKVEEINVKLFEGNKTPLIQEEE